MRVIKLGSKEEKKVYAKKYYQQNKTELLRKQKIYARQNREKISLNKKKYRAKNRDKYVLYNREYYAKNRTECRKLIDDWTKRNRKKLNEKSNEYYHIKADKTKIEARYKAKYYGVKKSFCEKCGAINLLQNHHPDYTKPLFTITLCEECHLNIHGKKGV